MYYFDNQYLQDYLKQDSNLQVLVNKSYLSIADESDIESPKIGVGYDANGKPSYFKYSEITAVKIGEVIYTIEQLNQFMDPKPEDSPEKKEEEPTKDKKESFSVGDYITNNNKDSKYYKTSGPIQSITEEGVSYKTVINEQYRTVICLRKDIIKG